MEFINEFDLDDVISSMEFEEFINHYQYIPHGIVDDITDSHAHYWEKYRPEIEDEEEEEEDDDEEEEEDDEY